MSLAHPTHISDAAFLAAIVESSSDAIITKDLRGVITTWNKAAEELFVYTAAEAIGRPVTMLIPKDRVDEEPGILARIRRGERVEHYETVRETKDGRIVHLSLTISPIRDENGNVIGASKIARDISERKRNQSELERYASIIASSSDAIISKDLNGIIQSWNRGAELIFGYTAEEAIGKSITMLMPPDRIDEEPGILARIRRGESVVHYETVRQAKDGRLLDISLNISPVRDANGVIVGASKIARNVTEHNRLDAAEREAEIMFRLVQTQEAERLRIARDLHDQVGQHLTAIRMTLESLSSLGEDAHMLERIALLKKITERMDRDLTYLTRELRPPEIEELGLSQALESLVSEWSEHCDIAAQVDVVVDGGVARFSPLVEANLYRIAQEALNNVAKHSNASKASVLMQCQQNVVFMIIEDDGHGFDPSRSENRTDGHGHGLRGMRERAESLNGKFLIESHPDKGTTVVVSVPLRAAESAATA